MSRLENAPQPSRAAFVCSAVAVAIIGSMAWFGVYTFVNAYLVTTLERSNAEWTRSTIWFLAGMFVGQLLSTELASRIGRRRTVTLALLLASCCFVMLAVFPSILLINMVLGLMGLVPALLVVVWVSLVAESGRDRPGRALATNMLVQAAVSVCVLAGAGKLATILNYPQLFALTGGVGFVCAAAFRVLSRRLEGKKPVKVTSLLRLKRADIRAMWSMPLVAVVLAGFMLEPFLWLTTNQLFPNLARGPFALGEDTIAMIVALGRAPSLVCLFAMRHVVDRTNPYRAYGVGMILVGLSVAVMGRTGGPRWLVANYLAFYLAHGIIWGSNRAALNRSVRPEIRDSAFAVANIITTSAVLVAGLTHNRMLEGGMSLAGVFTTCGVIGCAGGCVLVAFSFHRLLRERAH